LGSAVFVSYLCFLLIRDSFFDALEVRKHWFSCSRFSTVLPLAGDPAAETAVGSTKKLAFFRQVIATLWFGAKPRDGKEACSA
jgi:hypothetical protein